MILVPFGRSMVSTDDCEWERKGKIEKQKLMIMKIENLRVRIKCTAGLFIMVGLKVRKLLE